MGPSTDEIAFLEIAYEDVRPLCAHTREVFASESVRIAEAMGVPDPEPVPILVASAPVVAERCSGTGSALPGCTFSRDGEPVVISTSVFVLHEAVHALRFQHERRYTTSFFEEGLAQVVSAGEYFDFAASVDPRNAESTATTALGGELSEISYPVAGHFVGWLTRQFGVPTVMDFYRDSSGSTIEQSFETTIGVPFLVVLQDWELNAPTTVQVADDCDGALHPRWDAQTLTLNLDMACDADGGGPVGDIVTRAFCFETAEVGDIDVAFQSESGRGELSFRSLDCEDPGTGDSAAPKMVTPGPSDRLPFGRCRWQGFIVDDLDTAGPVQVELRR